MRNYTHVTKYKTKDGELHNTITEADAHVADCIKSTLLGTLQRFMSTNKAKNVQLTANDIFVLTEYLYEQRDSISYELNKENAFEEEPNYECPHAT